jgi:hypothetical protein
MYNNLEIEDYLKNLTKINDKYERGLHFLNTVYSNQYLMDVNKYVMNLKRMKL